MAGNFFNASKIAAMEKILSVFKQSWKIFLAVAAVSALNFISVGKENLIGAILIGALLNFFYFLSAAARLESAAKLSSSQAKRTMLVGLVLRLLMVLVVLGVAVKISQELFLATAICFVTFYLTSLVIIIRSERR